MRRNQLKRIAWCGGILSAAISLQTAAGAEDSSKPNVKQTSKQLEEVIKLLKQGENPSTEATAQDAKQPDKKTKAVAKDKAKP